LIEVDDPQNLYKTVYWGKGEPPQTP
jgi:hypothetical protein